MAPAPSARRGAGAGPRLRYRFDNALSRGPLVVIAYLGLLTLALILVAAVVASLFQIAFGGANGKSLAEAVWQTMLRTLDPGTFAGDTSWPSRILSLVITLTGIFLAGSLIGLIANAVDQRVERLRQGRSPVLEEGHTVILGWSPQVPQIVGELVTANASERRACIVVLADVDQGVAEAEVRHSVRDARSTKLVFRTGDPANPDDLEMCALRSARSVVIVQTHGDAGVIRSILAANAVDGGLDGRLIVAEVEDDNHAASIRSISDGQVVTVSRERIVAEVTAQACLQPGLAAVFTDFLDFAGDEVYFWPAGDLAGRTYRDALLAFDACSLMGRITAAGAVELNPPMDTTLAADDRLVLIAEDDSTIAVNPVEAPRRDVPAPEEAVARRPLHVVCMGWSSFGATVVREIDEFLLPGSHIDVLVDDNLVQDADVDPGPLRHASLKVHSGTGSVDDLLGLENVDEVDQVLVLAYRGFVDRQEADARTMLALLTLRNVAPPEFLSHVRIVAELLDPQNLRLATPVGADDLIVSDALASLYIAQLAERAELDVVFHDLFDAEGALMELRPASEFALGADVLYADVVVAGAARDCSVIGHRSGATKRVVLNPRKSETVHLGEDDDVIVLATRT